MIPIAFESFSPNSEPKFILISINLNFNSKQYTVNLGAQYSIQVCSLSFFLQSLGFFLTIKYNGANLTRII